MDNKKKIIGVCGARLFNQIPMQFINTLKKQSEKEGYFIIAFSSNSDDEEETDGYVGESQLYELAKYVNLSAIIVMSETLKNMKIINQIVEIGHNRGIPVFTLDGDAEGAISLNCDYYDGFEDMVRHVVEYHGCRKVNMLAGFKGNQYSDARIDAYKRVLMENGIPFEPERLAYGDFWERPAQKAVEGFLNSGKEFDAIVCANDSMAMTACSVLSEYGYEVPEDVIVTGFDGTIGAGYHFPVISTCEPDYENAIKFIMDKIGSWGTGKIQDNDRCTVNFKVKRSQSCGCMPKTMYEINTVISSLSHSVGDCSWHNIAMSGMITALLDKENIADIVDCIPEFTHLWSSVFRFACFKSSLFTNCAVTETYSEMTTILDVSNGTYHETGRKFMIEEFMPGIDTVMAEDNGIDVLFVRQFNSGRNVYGYIVEGYPVLEERAMQRCNEFAMFITHAVDNVIHNHKLASMNKDLKALNNNLEEAYNKIAGLYLKDYMTGLYNRRGFYEKIGLLAASHKCKDKYLYLFSIDIDRLKYINDNFGHAEGDFAITTVAAAISETSGEDAICARFGGDEFVCAFTAGSSGEYSAAEFYKKLLDNINNTKGVKDKEYPVGASIGMCCCHMEDDIDIENMILSADKNMYKDKSEHRQEYQKEMIK